MNKTEINTFIEEMEAIGDDGDSTLEEALADRKSALNTFFDIIGKVINRK